MKRQILLILTVLLLTPAVFAQNVLQVEFLVGTVQFKKIDDGAYQILKKETLIGPGTIIRTGKAAQVRLMAANGVKILIIADSTFQIDHFEENLTRIQLYTGEGEFRVRQTQSFEVRTSSLVAGVRGTLFRVSTRPGGLEKVVVYEGSVDVSSPLYPNQQALEVKAGQKMEWIPAKEDLSARRIRSASSEELEFQLVEGPPQVVQKQQEETTFQGEEQPLKQAEEKPLKIKQEAQERKGWEGKKTIPEEEKKSEKPSQKETEDPRKKNLYFEFFLGGIGKEDYFYHSLSFTSYLRLGKWIQMGLILPVYYDGKSKIYDVKKWENYQEWNFQNIQDAVHDALLKILYFRFREKGDVLFMGVGHLENITLGSGFMVRNFDNSPLYPSEKKLGLEGGFDIGSTALYFFMNDLYDPEIVGGRIFLRPLFGVPILGNFQFGFQISADKNPLDEYNNPAYMALGVDVLFSLFESESFSLTFSLDVAKQGLYYRDWENHPTDWADGTDLFHFHFNDNYGAGLGVEGNITSYFTYDLRYYYLHSGFVARYFDRFYLVNRRSRTLQVLTPGLSDAHGMEIQLGGRLPHYVSAQLGYYRELQSPAPQDRLFVSVQTERRAFFGFWFSGLYEKKNISNLFSGKDSYGKDATLDLKLGYEISHYSDLIFRKLIQYSEEGKCRSKIILETNLVF